MQNKKSNPPSLQKPFEYIMSYDMAVMNRDQVVLTELKATEQNAQKHHNN